MRYLFTRYARHADSFLFSKQIKSNLVRFFNFSSPIFISFQSISAQKKRKDIKSNRFSIFSPFSFLPFFLFLFIISFTRRTRDVSITSVLSQGYRTKVAEIRGCLKCVSRTLLEIKRPPGRASADISQYRGEQLIVSSLRAEFLPFSFSSFLLSAARSVGHGLEEKGSFTRQTMRSVRIVAQRCRYNGVPRLLCNCASLEY